MKISKPTVSVCIPTYQHVNFIQQCLDSVLSQKTSFEIEILIGDDGSSDGTETVCEQYAQLYPEVITLIRHDREGAERKTYTGCPGSYNLVTLIGQARGEFIAVCEGDDYWIDDNKLELQVTFLRDNPSCSGCFHPVKIDSSGELKKDFITRVDKEVFTLEDMARGNCIHTPSVLYRNIFELPFPEFFKASPVLDYLLHCFASEKGPIGYIGREMAVYRVHDKSYWSSTPAASRTLKWIEVLLPLIDHFDKGKTKQHFVDQLFIHAVNWLRQSKKADAEQQQCILSKLASIDIQRLTELMINQNQAPSTFIEKAIQLAESGEDPLPTVVNNLLAKKDGLQSSPEAKRQILFQMVEHLVSNLTNETNYQLGKFIGKTGCEELNQAYWLFNKFFDGSQQSSEITEIKSSIRRLIEQDQYQRWIHQHELREVDAEVLAERMMLHWQYQPVLHCFMFVLPGEESLLADTIDSLSAQLLKGWNLTVIALTEAPDVVFEQVDFLHWRTLLQGDDPYQVLNAEIANQPSDWISFIEPGLQYSPQSLAKIADAMNLNPSCSFFYSDDDRVDSFGGRSSPRFKPDFNIDLLRSSPYIGNSWVPAGQLLQMGGIKPLPGAENYNLALEWFDTFGEEAFFHVADVLTHKSSQVDRPFDSEAGKEALSQHFERRGLKVEIASGYVDDSYRVVYQHDSSPKVSIIIPTKDKLEFLQPCVESLLDKTRYTNYEVFVVDNQSSDPDTLDYYETLTSRYPDKVRVLFFDKPFNFSEMNNWAAAQSDADFLLLLNNDTEIIQPEWLDRMLNHGQREEVGVVGARLLYPESGRAQHLGVILGMTQIADHPYNDLLTMNDSSHMERARLDQNYSAVTAAVMLVKRDLYQQVGGMDSENLAVLFNDVDLCLRIGEMGYKIVWTPFAMAIHHGSSSLRQNEMQSFYFDMQAHAKKYDRTRKEQRYMLNKWMPLLARDPAFNPNLSLINFNFSPELNAPLNWSLDYHLRLKTFGVPISGGSGDYRLRQPSEALSKAGLAMCEVGGAHLNVVDLERLKPHTVIFQNAINDYDFDLLRMYKEFQPSVQVVFLLDDLLHDLPEKSSQYRPIKAAYRDARTRLRRALKYCDRLIVSTEPLRQICVDMIDDIVVIPNRLVRDKWVGLHSKTRQSSKPRVGWAGAQQHQGDLELIYEVVRETAEEIDWIFFGMCPDEIKEYVSEEHHFVPIDEYPAKLASLNLDLAVAPLELHDFNKAKSNLRLLEYGIMGWPVICSDIYPYQTNDAPVIRVSNNKAEWVAAIRQILADPVALAESGKALKEWVIENYLLEDHLEEWLFALAPPNFQTSRALQG